MINTYFVAYNYRFGNAAWEFDNIELNTEQPLEEIAQRNAVVDYIESVVQRKYGCALPLTVVISNWILLHVDASAGSHALNYQHTFGLSDTEVMKMTYFVAYNNNPAGTNLWHCGNVEITVDQVMEHQSTRDVVGAEIERDLSRRFGGSHSIVISNWKLLRTYYPATSREISKI